MSASPVHVLLIDDDKDIIILIHELLSGMKGWNFKADWVNSYQRAREVIAEHRHDVYLVDYRLPDGDGISLIREATAGGMREPMVLITALNDAGITGEALQAGAVDVLDKTELGAGLLERVIAYALERADRMAALRQVQDDIEKRVSATCADLRAENRQLKQELARTRQETLRLEHRLLQSLQLLALSIESRGPGQAGDHQRVAQLASAIAVQLGMDQETVDSVYVGALLHDVGNMTLPAELLNKTQQLPEPEMDMLRRHSILGRDIALNLGSPDTIARMVQQHHERYDGSGYPEHLQGDDILLEARILAVADTITAMTSPRPYRPASEVTVALSELRRQRGRQFDPEVVDACLRVFEEKFER